MDQACSCLLGNAVTDDDIIVTSVKMPFTEDDKTVASSFVSLFAGWR